MYCRWCPRSPTESLVSQGAVIYGIDDVAFSHAGQRRSPPLALLTEQVFGDSHRDRKNNDARAGGDTKHPCTENNHQPAAGAKHSSTRGNRSPAGYRCQLLCIDVQPDSR
jgi:hypothetical protein